MKIKNKGRKIYKTKEKNYYGKSPMGKFLSGALTVLLIGGIGFLGYSAAEPIINYTKHKGDIPDNIEPTEALPDLEEPSETATEPPTEIQTEAPTEAVEILDFMAAELAPDDITSIEKLKNALDIIPNNGGINYVVIPLKVKGGGVYYSSSVQEAAYSNAIMSEIPLSDIIKEIEKSGYKPSADISVFYDNILPVVYPDSGYVRSLDGTQWLDANNKPWATPYSQTALDYNASIVSEITEAGIDEIICSDLIFPDFTSLDLNELDPVLSQNDRCISMTSAANLLYDRAVSNGASMHIGITAEDIMHNRTDILRAMLLSTNFAVLDIDLDKLGEGVYDGSTLYEFTGTTEENIRKCLDIVESSLADLNVTIRISGASHSNEELLEAVKSVSEDDSRSFIIG